MIAASDARRHRAYAAALLDSGSFIEHRVSLRGAYLPQICTVTATVANALQCALDRMDAEGSMGLLSRLRAGFSIIDPRRFAMTPARCPFCGPSVFVRLNESDAGIRCVRCTASVVHLSLGQALRDIVGDVSGLDACELSASGPVVRFLATNAKSLATSEYLDGVPHGTMRDGIRSEDVQSLTYADARFDLVTHTEIMEHVADDASGFRQLRRILRPGGTMIFTVPLTAEQRTLQRAHAADGRIEHLMPPAYHTDPLRGDKSAFVFREYGLDIVDRVQAAGFSRVFIVSPTIAVSWIDLRNVVVACA